MQDYRGKWRSWAWLTSAWPTMLTYFLTLFYECLSIYLHTPYVKHVTTSTGHCQIEFWLNTNNKYMTLSDRVQVEHLNMNKQNHQVQVTWCQYNTTYIGCSKSADTQVNYLFVVHLVGGVQDRWVFNAAIHSNWFTSILFHLRILQTEQKSNTFSVRSHKNWPK